MVNILILKFFFLFLAESPSSSASDIDNLNIQSTVAKAVSARGVYSPQIASNPISRNNHHLMGLLSYVSSWCHFQFYRQDLPVCLIKKYERYPATCSLFLFLLNASIISQKLLMCNLLAVTLCVRVSVLVLASVQVHGILLADFQLLVRIIRQSSQ